MTYPRRNALTQRFTLGAPRTFSISPDGKTILFCRSTAGDDPINRLWALDLGSGEPVERMIADPVEVLANSVGENELSELSEEEKARRERLREAGGGIVTYSCNFEADLVTYVLGTALYKTTISTGVTTMIPDSSGAFDPRISPNGETIAFCSNGDVKLHRNNEIRNLTSVLGNRLPGEKTWGLAEFVAAEEMGRRRGHWWSPDSDALAICCVDNANVQDWWISEPVDPAKEPRAMPYPAAGTKNADLRVFIVAANEGPAVKLCWDYEKYEYLCRLNWTREGLFLMVQSRDQKDIVYLKADPKTGETHEVAGHSDPAWVELIPGSPAYVDAAIIDVRDDLDCDTRRLYRDGEAFSPAGLQIRSIIAADQDGVIVTANQDPTELNVVCVDYSGSVTEISPNDGIQTGVANSTGAGAQRVCVVNSSDMSSPMATTRLVRCGKADSVIESFAEKPELEYNIELSKIGERDLSCALVLPSGRTGSDGPLPVLLDPYGGPHALRVLKRQSAYSQSQWFADQGFAVIICDGAGTPARGPNFEREVLGNLADPVLADQIEALHAIDKANPDLLDLERVAIRGWSFGGYLAALAVMKRPDIFHAAVAGAPVTDWLLYDTHYTERYLGHPETNPDAYHQSDLMPLAAELERPLMLIHGLADDNVVAAHTFELSRALLEAGRPHQVLPLSGVSHMTPQAEVAENILKLQVAFLKKELA